MSDQLGSSSISFHRRYGVTLRRTPRSGASNAEESRTARDPERERRDAEAAGLEVVDLRAERLRMEFHGIAAVVHFLRKVIWMVPGFTVEAYRPRLRELHERIEAEGCFVAHSSRHLVEARRSEARARDPRA